MQNCWKYTLLSLLLTILWVGGHAQDQATLNGVVKNQFNQRLKGIVVMIEGDTVTSDTTDSEGKFTLMMPAGRKVIEFYQDGDLEGRSQVDVLAGDKNEILRRTLRDVRLEEVTIKDRFDTLGVGRGDFMEVFPIDPKEITRMPSFKPDLTSKLVTLPGVSSNNEFSSQYRVRGGNFDENLIYVNDIEIYRPFLRRSGQQEGLGFVNPNLVDGIRFSTGGFQARYGDKMSSALDVTYRKPTEFHGTAELGILTQNVHLEGTSKNKADSTEPGRFTYLVGARSFVLTYLLNSLDTQGDYKPSFQDVQGIFAYKPKLKDRTMKIRTRRGVTDTVYLPKDRIVFSSFFNFARNNYRFTPTGRETTFGTVQNVLRLRVAFAGQEVSQYLTGFGAITMEHKPTYKLKMKYIVSGFQTTESELFDVEGGYFLSDVNSNFGSEGFNEVLFDRGIGTFFSHGRNYLSANVLSVAQRGEWIPGRGLSDSRHKVEWGVRFQRQWIDDELSEWYGTDSSGFFQIEDVFRSSASLRSNQYKLYLQDAWKLNKSRTVRLVLGSRALYNDLNGQFLVTPRVQFVIDPMARLEGDLSQTPDSTIQKWKKQNWQLRFAAGMYAQPPFYREMRAFDGTLNTDAKAQTAIHFIAGGDYLFQLWNRPFKLFGEAYYKQLNNLLTYEVDNVRIRYYPFNPAKGFAYGADFKVNGEFIKGIDSWMSLSYLNTQEDVEGDTRGYVRRPADQRVTFAMYFQDELPVNPTFKAHINFIYGSGLPFGPPRVLDNRTVFVAPSYQRVDLGFSKLITFRSREERGGKLGLESLWATVEVFNLFQRANTVSYTWIEDVFTVRYAVPNYLSSRLINARVVVKF